MSGARAIGRAAPPTAERGRQPPLLPRAGPPERIHHIQMAKFSGMLILLPQKDHTLTCKFYYVRQILYESILASLGQITGRY